MPKYLHINGIQNLRWHCQNQFWRWLWSSSQTKSIVISTPIKRDTMYIILNTHTKHNRPSLFVYSIFTFILKLSHSVTIEPLSWFWESICVSKMTRHDDKKFNSPYSPLDRLVEHHEHRLVEHREQELVILHCKCKKIVKCYHYNASKVKLIHETRVYIFQCTKYCHHIFER
jgi:hypothetical protein